MYNFEYIFINIILYIILYKLMNVHMYTYCYNVIATTLSKTPFLLLFLHTRPPDINRKDEAVFYL